MNRIQDSSEHLELLKLLFERKREVEDVDASVGLCVFSITRIGRSEYLADA